MTLKIQTLMVATDFSEASEAAMAYAFRLARTLNALLYIVHVVPEDDVQLLTELKKHLQSQITAETLCEVLYADADKRLTAAIEQMQGADLVQERLIVTGKPAEAIVSWAASKQPQMLILGTHRRQGLDHLLLGSVAERVLRQAPCSMLIVPAQPATAGA
jgi:nucleotide-binding universal stress UspA family protein